MIQVVKRGDVFIADLPYVAGSMQYGIRPVVAVSNNKCNDNSNTITILPFTTSETKSRLPTHVEVDKNSTTHNLRGIALAECITTIDKCLLKKKIGTCSSREMLKISVAILIQVGIDIFDIIKDCTIDMFKCIRGHV